jgi:hypothetical protein
MYFESKGPGAIRGLTFEDGVLRRTLNGMKYRDVEYSIVQGVERGKWMWSLSLSLDTNVKTSSQANNKPAAVIAAERAIDRALAPKKRLVPPRS